MRDFLSQGGYAFFVWGSYGMTLLLLGLEVVLLSRQRRTILTRLGRLVRMRARGGN
ncbi:heme exporter protein CcmD [Thioalkalicoccus limnaeus]|uniref:Heme exporter protein D n=1 Tax=Thioalkalicoccus limnaeus TaxID=120681 RepID=A0ABV4BBD1_9GAMM